MVFENSMQMKSDESECSTKSIGRRLMKSGRCLAVGVGVAVGSGKKMSAAEPLLTLLGRGKNTSVGSADVRVAVSVADSKHLCYFPILIRRLSSSSDPLLVKAKEDC